jgi:hypothetical protein
VISVGRIAASPRRKNRWKSSANDPGRCGAGGMPCGGTPCGGARSEGFTPDGTGDCDGGAAGEFVAPGSTSHRCLYRNVLCHTDLRSKQHAPRAT